MWNVFSWIAVLIAVLVSQARILAAEPIERSLFDGKSLTSWDGDPRFWRAENGEVIGETTAAAKAEKNTFLIHRGGVFGDFDLRFQYQVRGGNSGIQYRSVEKGPWSIGGYQADFEYRHQKSNNGLIDKFTGMFFEEQGRGFMGQRGQTVIVKHNSQNARKPLLDIVGSVGDPSDLEKVIDRDGWNEMRVIARGYTFVHVVNGRVMSIAFDEDVPNRRSDGLVAFQLHAGPPMQIRIKDLMIRE